MPGHILQPDTSQISEYLLYNYDTSAAEILAEACTQRYKDPNQYVVTASNKVPEVQQYCLYTAKTRPKSSDKNPETR